MTANRKQRSLLNGEGPILAPRRRLIEALLRRQNADRLPIEEGLSILNTERIEFAPRLRHSISEMGREHAMV